MQKMFSSTNKINPFAHLPSSSYHPPHPHPHPQALLLPQPPLFSHESNDILLNQHNDLLSASSFLPPNPQFTESLVNMALLNNGRMAEQDGVVGIHGECFGASGFGIPDKKAVKKDRHSKICTAQGIRDRRVRLSIDIAREFFDLQDMLGFDKASKTLEWLLMKSKNAITELVKMKHGGNGSSGGQRSFSSSSSPECEIMVAEEGGELDGGRLEGTAFKSQSMGDVSKDQKKMKKLQKATAPLLVKESRAKARARARERTREKMSTSGSSNITHEWQRCPDSSLQFLNQLRPFSQLEASKKSDHSYVHNMGSSYKVVAHQVEEPSAAPTGNVMGESIVIKRKLKPSAILGYQQNLASSKDVSCSTSGNIYFPNLPQNWDINGAIAYSTF